MMANIISVFKPGSWEYEQLRIAAEMLTEKSPNGYKYYVGETYFYDDQNWKWTTILYANGFGWGYQAITPEQQEEIILSKDLDATTDSLIYWKNVK